MKKAVIISALIALISAFTGCSGTVADEHTTSTSETTAGITSISTTTTAGTTVTTETEEQTTAQTTTKSTTTKTTTTTATTKATTTKAKTTKAKTTKAKTTKATTTKKKTTKAQTTTQMEKEDNSELLEEILQELNNKRLYIAELKLEIDELTDQASALYVGFRQDVDKLKERYAAMGMLNSGAYTGSVRSLEQNYKSNLAPISQKIDKLEKELEEAEEECAQLEEEYTLSEWELEEIIHEAYLEAVEEFQQNTLP